MSDAERPVTFAFPLKRRESCPTCGEQYLEVATMKEENWRLKGIEDRLCFEIETLNTENKKLQEQNAVMREAFRQVTDKAYKDIVEAALKECGEVKS